MLHLSKKAIYPIHRIACNYTYVYRTIPVNKINIQCSARLLHALTKYYSHFKYEYAKQENENSSYWNFKVVLLSFSFFGLMKEKKEDEESELVLIIKRGILAMQKGELDKSEQLLHLALKTAQELENFQGITYIYDMLANVAFQKKEFEKAIKLFKEVLQRILLDGLSEDDNAVVEISLKMASCFSALGDQEKAIEGFHFCLATQEKKLKLHGEKNLDTDTLALWAMSMDWYARFLVQIRQYDLAKEHFLRAYEVSLSVNGREHEQTAVLLNDIGSVCAMQEKYKDAIQNFNDAIEIACKLKSEDLPSFYINLGSVYMHQNVHLEAEKYCNYGYNLAIQNKNNEAILEAKNCLSELKILKRK